MASETTTDASAGDEDTLTINLTLTAAPSKPRIPITVTAATTPSQLRAQAAEATKIPAASLRLIFRGRLIADDDTKQVVTEFKLEDDCVVHCMGKPEAASAAAAAAPAPTTSAPSMPTTAGSSVSVTGGMAPVVTASAVGADPLQEALATLRSNPPDVYLTAVTTLEKILTNITSHATEEKYRRVKKQNAAFQRRLGGLTGGDAAMKAVGFTIETADGEESYVMVPSAEAWPKLLANKAALAQTKSTASSASAPAAAPMPVPGAAAAPAFGAGAPGFGGTGAPGFGNVPPGMESAVSNLMSNPSQLQAMLQNPMVQQMMERDPRFANNPALRQSMQQMASNPEMVTQLTQAMQDPAMQRQMQSMMNSGNMPSGMGGGIGNTGGMGGFGSGTAGTTAPNTSAPANTAGSGQGGNNSSNAQQTGQTVGRSDEDMTEEEMLAEAIARSLRET